MRPKLVEVRLGERRTVVYMEPRDEVRHTALDRYEAQCSVISAVMYAPAKVSDPAPELKESSHLREAAGLH